MLQPLLRDDFDGAVKAAGRLQDIFGRDNLFVELQDHGIPEQHRTNPHAPRDRPAAAGAAARHQRQPLRRTASDAVAHDALLCVQTGSLMSDPDRFKFHGDEHYLKSAHGDAPPVRRAARGVRQHAVDRRAGRRRRSSSASRSCPTFPLPEGFDDRHRLPAPPHLRGRQASAGASQLPDDDRRAPRLRARRSSTSWGSRRTSSSCGTSSSTPATTTSASARAGAARPAARWPTRSGSPTSTRSSTTCCSSASSTRAASRCPTSTWTSTPATGTR